MKVWILGAGGQLGSALTDVCQAMGASFVASKRQDVDITDLESLKRVAGKIRPTHVINCAAYTDVDRAEEESQSAYAINANGPENLGALAREFPLRVVHVSTDFVFDGTKGSPYVETDPTAPLGVYGKSKLEGELALFDLLPSACIVRTSGVFGHTGRNFVSMVLTLLQERERLRAVHDQVGRVTFNRDLAQALLDLSCHSGLFHFANGGELSRYQIVQDFHQEAQNRSLPLKCQEITPVPCSAFPTASPRPPYSVLDTTKVEGVLGRKPRMWKTVLGEYLDHVTKTL